MFSGEIALRNIHIIIKGIELFEGIALRNHVFFSLSGKAAKIKI